MCVRPKGALGFTDGTFGAPVELGGIRVAALAAFLALIEKVRPCTPAMELQGCTRPSNRARRERGSSIVGITKSSRVEIASFKRGCGGRWSGGHSSSGQAASRTRYGSAGASGSTKAILTESGSFRRPAGALGSSTGSGFGFGISKYISAGVAPSREACGLK